MSADTIRQTALEGLDTCIAGVDAAAGGVDSFRDAGTLAEFLLCFPEDEVLKPFSKTLADAALRWLQEGVLERAYVHSAQNEQSAIMLFALSQESTGFRQENGAILKTLVDGGVIGRSEMPLSWNAVMRARLLTAGIKLASAFPSPLQLQNNLDRRLLRAHVDSYDLNSLLAVAQVAGLGIVKRSELPTRFATVFVLHAAANNHVGWLSLGALLGADYYGLPAPVLEMARDKAITLVGESDDLLPGPPDSDRIDDPARISGHGVRIRGTLAYLCLIEREVLC